MGLRQNWRKREGETGLRTSALAALSLAPSFHRLRLPLVEELNYVIFGEKTRLLKLAGRVEKAPVAVQDRNRGHALLQVNVVLLGKIQVLGIPAHVHVHHDEVAIQKRRHARLVEGVVQDVAIATPVPAKDEQNALLFLAGGRGGLADLCTSIRVSRVELHVGMRGGLQRRVLPLGEGQGAE